VPADDAATALRQALEEASRLRRENAALTQQNRDGRTQLFGEAGARISAQDAAIDGQISAFEQQHAAAQAEHSRLLRDGDFAGASAATAKMVTASSRIETLRTQKDQVAQQRANLEHQQTQPTNQNPPEQDPAFDNATERERQWIAEHPAFLADPHFRNRVNGAAAYAGQTLGLDRNSAEYIAEIDRIMSHGSAPAMSVPSVDPNDPGADTGASDVTVPRMPQPDVPPAVSVDPNDPLSNETRMVDEMYPQTRAVGNGGAGIRSVAAPPTRRIQELSRAHAGGRAIEPTLEELDTARTIIPQILGAEGAAMSDEDKIRTYHAWYNSPSSQRKLRRWYGRTG
jgi:hypothetical protein